MNVCVGAKVKLVNDVGEGIVVKITNSTSCMVEIDGFEYPYKTNELIVIDEQISKEQHTLSNVSLTEKPADQPTHAARPAPVDGQKTTELDLHWEHLMDIAPSHVSPLEFQIAYFETRLQQLQKKGTRKMVVIHGKGEGKLKFHVRDIAERKYGCTCEDASMKEYHLGATLLFIPLEY